MSLRNGGSMMKESGQLSMGQSHRLFSPLLGGMEQSATTFYKLLASLISDRCTKPYSQILNWIRCRLSFSLLRSAVLKIFSPQTSVLVSCFSWSNYCGGEAGYRTWLTLLAYLFIYLFIYLQCIYPFIYLFLYFFSFIMYNIILLLWLLEIPPYWAIYMYEAALL